MTESRDFVDRLMDAADRVDELSRSEIQVLLRLAAEDIRTLRTLVGIRDEVWIENEPPEGNA